jgi:F5/8 type C domain
MTKLKLTKHVLPLILLIAIAIVGCKKDNREYELLPPDPEVETDVTNLGTLSVNIENSGGPNANEGSPKLVDGDMTTKFLLNPYAADLYMQITFRTAQRISAYNLTSANDAASRDPKDWKIQASNDGNTWIDLDTRSGETFPSRGLTRRYNFSNTTDYKIYRFSVTAVGSGTLFQLAEWGLIRVPLGQ